MDYKERYEMALEGIQEILSSGEDSIKMSRLQLRLQGIFPELAESKDEKVRKEILELVRQSSEILEKKNQERMIAWLEKQGEQKPDWSEKDEKIRQTIINEFKQCSEWYCSNGLTKEDCINWLNKQEYFEWGDEDNENMNSLCVLLDQMVSINAIGNEHSIEYKNWLKSLKQRIGG